MEAETDAEAKDRPERPKDRETGKPEPEPKAGPPAF